MLVEAPGRVLSTFLPHYLNSETQSDMGEPGRHHLLNVLQRCFCPEAQCSVSFGEKVREQAVGLPWVKGPSTFPGFFFFSYQEEGSSIGFVHQFKVLLLIT